MASQRQLERFFEGTGVQVEDMQNGKDAFLLLVNNDIELTIMVAEARTPLNHSNRSKLVIRYSKR